LLRGLPAAREQSVVAEIGESELEFAAIAADGTVTITVDGLLDTYPNPQTILDAAREAREKAVSYIMADLTAEYERAIADSSYVPSLPTAPPHLAGLVDNHPVSALYHERRAERLAREEAQREAREKAKEAAKQATIAEWVAEHGTASQKARLADGLLCRDEIVSAIAGYVLDPIGPPEGEVVICDDNDHMCGREEVACLSEAEYTAWQAIKAGLPEGSTWSFERVTPCVAPCTEADAYRGDGLGEPYATASITVPYGPFKFKRTIALR
jgi:hypothetical protein